MRARRALVIRLRPERREKYLANHRAVWPQVQEAMRQAGHRNYSLFLRDDLLFCYFEHDPGVDIDRLRAAMRALRSARCRRLLPRCVRLRLGRRGGHALLLSVVRLPRIARLAARPVEIATHQPCPNDEGAERETPQHPLEHEGPGHARDARPPGARPHRADKRRRGKPTQKPGLGLLLAGGLAGGLVLLPDPHSA